MKKRRDLTSWTKAREFSIFRGELLSATGRDFEKAALLYLRASWPAVVAGPPLGEYDRAGVDMLVFRTDGCPELVVQCKGFFKEERELGTEQVHQCTESIETFRKSGLRADKYILLYNRPGRWKPFRDVVSHELQRLEIDCIVNDADLWSVDDLLRMAFNGVLRKIKAALRSNNASHALPLGSGPEIEAVPFLRSILTLDQTRALTEEQEERNVANIARYLLDQTLQPPTRRQRRRESGAAPRLQRKTILLGEFGSGKTTIVLSAMRMLSERILYVPAARIVGTTRSAKDFFAQCLDFEMVFDAFPETDHQKLSAIARPIVLYLLKDPRSEVALVLDGLDESEYLAHGGALQAVFNFLREINAPVIVTMRTGFWNLRRAELDAAIGPRGPEPKIQRLPILTILPWEEQQLFEFVEKSIDSCCESTARKNLSLFKEMISAKQYEAVFGNLPQRPLFLAMLVEWVAERGLVRVGRAKLFQYIATTKVARDVIEPQKWGGHRLSFTGRGDSVHVTQEFAWRAMLHAACEMTTEIEGRFEMTSSCTIDKLIERDPQLQRLPYDPLALVLNSLLVSDGPPRPGRSVSVHFAHRAFQEFFLAIALLEKLEVPANGEVPKAVSEWTIAIKEEGILTPRIIEN